MLFALLLAWIAVSLAVTAVVAKLNQERRHAALPERCRERLEHERVLLVDSKIVVVGRRIDARGRREVVLDCDGTRTTITIDELLGAPLRRVRRPEPRLAHFRGSHEVAGVEP